MVVVVEIGLHNRERRRALARADRHSGRSAATARVFGGAGRRRPADGSAEPLGKSQSYRPTPVDQPLKAVPAAVAAAREADRWRQLLGLRRLSSKPRVRKCKRPIGQSRVGLVAHAGGAHMTGLESCANVWVCPKCAPKIRAGRMRDVLTAFERHAANGGGFAFLTLTLQHDGGERLRLLLDHLGAAWKFVAAQREYKEWRKRLGLVGSITALEVTDGVNGWHPHRHVMLLFERPLSRDEVSAFESVLDDLYGRHLEKQGRKRGGVDRETGRNVGARLDYVPEGDGAAEQLGRYITKLQAGFELTRSDLKQSRTAKGRQTFELLDDALAGDQAAVDRWHEYERAMTGKSAVRFSKGLRAHLDMDKAMTDEELAAEEVGGDAGLYLSAPLYRRLFWDGQIAPMLGVFTASGDLGVMQLVAELYPGRYVAEDGHYPGALLLQ